MSRLIWDQYQAYRHASYFLAPNGITATTVNLNAAYVYGVSGPAYCYSFFCPESADLTDFWLRVTALAGTWGATDGNLNVEIRVGGTGTRQPSSTLLSSFTVPVAAAGWVKRSGLSIGLTAGKTYYVVVADADGSATNYATVAACYSNFTGASVQYGSQLPTTTDGFATAGANTASASPAAVMKIGGSLYGGGAFDAVATYSSSAERGLRFSPPQNCLLVGLAMGTSMNNLYNGQTVRLYADGTAPGGTALMSYTFPSNVEAAGMAMSLAYLPPASRVSLTGGTFYRLVTPFSGPVPRKITINGSPDADVIASNMPFGNAHWTEASGGAWNDAQANVMSELSPVLIPAAGGGSSPFYILGGSL